MSLIPLAMLPPGAKGKVVNIVGGRGAVMKLMAMGIVPGKEIKVKGRRGGVMLVSVNGTKLVVGRGLAMKVIVDAEKEG